MLPQLKAFKYIALRFKPLVLGLMSCVLCVLVSTIPLNTWGKSTAQMARSRLLTESAVPLTAQAGSPSNREQQDRPVLVTEVVIQGASGQIQQIAYQAATTKPKQITTRTQLQRDINAIFKTGWFSHVKVVPQDTPKGVRVTFVVQVNPVLRQVKIVLSQGNQPILPVAVVDDSFRSQYGNILNLQTLQAGIHQLNQWYQTNGYVLAQVLGKPKVSKDGIVTLQIAEGVIDSIQVQFVSEDKPIDVGESIVSKTPTSIIFQAIESKPGMTFNYFQIEQDVKRVFGLGTLQANCTSAQSLFRKRHNHKPNSSFVWSIAECP